MSTVAIIQARMSSTRLPGKVLLPLANKTVLEHVVLRLKSCRLIDRIVVATSIAPEDQAIAELCSSLNVDCFRGNLNDVLDRFFKCASYYDAENIVRITSDCPVIDPVVVDSVISGFKCGNYDYYALDGDFPDGLDCEVFKYSALKIAWTEATLPSEREHVCPYIHTTHKLDFKIGGLTMFSKLKHMRWTLDEPNDYSLLSNIYDNLYCEDYIFLTNDILSFLEKNSDLLTLNKSIIRNSGYEKSLKDDSIFLSNKS